MILGSRQEGILVRTRKSRVIQALMESLQDLTGQINLLWSEEKDEGGPLSGRVEVRMKGRSRSKKGAYWAECIEVTWEVRGRKKTKECLSCEHRIIRGHCCKIIWDRVFLIYSLTEEQDRSRWDLRDFLLGYPTSDILEADPLSEDQAVGWSLSLSPGRKRTTQRLWSRTQDAPEKKDLASPSTSAGGSS